MKNQEPNQQPPYEQRPAKPDPGPPAQNPATTATASTPTTATPSTPTTTTPAAPATPTSATPTAPAAAGLAPEIQSDDISPRWQAWRDRLPLADYEAKFAKLEAEGNNVHGEVDALDRLRSKLNLDLSSSKNCELDNTSPNASESDDNDSQKTKLSILDAGCGTGRAAVELNNRGWSVTAVDYDPDMIALARSKSDGISWHHGSLVDVQLEQTFDVVLMAGNILLFVHEGTEPAILANMASHLNPGGLLVAGFGLGTFTIETYEQWCADAGLELFNHRPTWDEVASPHANPFDVPDANYIVAIHRKPAQD